MSKIKTFRGKLATGTQAQIHLAGGDADTGYKIVKLQLFHTDPGIGGAEHTIKVYAVKQTAIDAAVDFNDETLLGVGYLEDHQANEYPVSTITVFDQTVFNQDIFVTCIDTKGSDGCNYYIELEEVKMSKNEQAVVNFKSALIHTE